MLYHRNKIFLTLLSLISRERYAIYHFHILLALYAVRCEESPSYLFLPLKGMLTSFQLERDYERLIELGWLVNDEENYRLVDEKREAIGALLTRAERNKMERFIKVYQAMSPDEWLNELKERSPQYRELFLMESHHTTALDSEPSSRKTDEEKRGILLSIGYESYSIDQYIAQLKRYNIDCLIDVRGNARSRKYGFAKSRLESLLNRVGIDYCHLPQLGIEQDARQDLTTSAQFNQLFDRYANEVLEKEQESLDRLITMIEDGDNIAITCVEAEEKCCHRSRIIARLVEQNDVMIERIL